MSKFSLQFLYYEVDMSNARANLLTTKINRTIIDKRL